MLSITWGTKTINVLQADLTPISGTLYELDTNQFRKDLKALEDDAEGMPFPDTHQHNTEVTVAGVTYARFVEIINGYSVTFEDGQYSVRLAGSNNNIFDVENGILNQNQVQVIPGNAAGLIVVSSGSGLSQAEHDHLLALDTDYLKNIIDGKKALIKNGSTWKLIIYDPADDVTPILNKEMKDKDGADISDLTAGILAQELANSI